MGEINTPEQVYAFATDKDPIFSTEFGSGHINRTYLIIDSSARQYILQKINKNVFRNPQAVMENIVAVTNHIKKHVSSTRQVLCLIPTKTGENWLVDNMGEYWRMYSYISDSICLTKTENPEDFEKSGAAFGHFQCLLSDFPAHTLNETIPKFHDTPNRYQRFKDVLAANPHNRAKEVSQEIDFALAREEYANTLMSLLNDGHIPLRVTHNDTKLSNVLFDRETRTALCVVDLDTVMPGLAANDFGDSIRFGASTAAEDEADLSKVTFSVPLFEAYTSGFLSSCGENLTECELQHLRDGAKMMTLECGLRFLTDYLEGDVYFRIHKDDHNLDRCRTQFKLVSDMEKHWEQMQQIIFQSSNFRFKP